MSSLGVGALLIVALVAAGGLGAVYQRSAGATRWVPRALRLLATMLTVVISVGFAAFAWEDSGAFGLVLVGIPVVCCLLALGADLAEYRTALLTTLAAAALVVWSLVTVVGLGLYFLAPAIVLAAAAATTWQTDRPSRLTPPNNRPATPTAAH